MGVARRSCFSLVLVIGLLAIATPAWAHGQVRPGRTAAGATVHAVLVVPSERAGHRNSGIALALPPGFVATSCGSPSGWRCSTASKGFTWERVTGEVEVEEFDLTIQVAGTPGTYVLPLSQRYDDGVTRTFSGGPGSRGEAPLFTLTGGGGAPSTTAPAVAPTAPAPAGLDALPVGRRLAPPSSDGAPIALVAAGFVALTVLGGAVLFARQRRAGAAEDDPEDSS